MVGPHVALAAVVGSASLRDREGVPVVTGRATPLAPVGVETSDPGVRPGSRIEAPVFEDFDLGPVALPAAIDGRSRNAIGEALGLQTAISLHDLGEDVVQRPENASGLGVMGVGELLYLLLMATGAVLGRDDHGDQEVFVVERIAVSLLGLMALVAADVRAVMFAPAPLLVDDPAIVDVAVNAFEGFLAQLARESRSA
jgi:hypothetical protein